MSEVGSDDGTVTYERPPSSLKMSLQRLGDQLSRFEAEISLLSSDVQQIRTAKDELRTAVNHALDESKDFALKDMVKSYDAMAESLGQQRVENMRLKQQVELLKDERKDLLMLVAIEQQRLAGLQAKLGEQMD